VASTWPPHSRLSLMSDMVDTAPSASPSPSALCAAELTDEFYWPKATTNVGTATPVLLHFTSASCSRGTMAVHGNVMLFRAQLLIYVYFLCLFR
jgi:hypothetical protein